MHDVEAHVAGPRDAADRVQVRTVVVHERAHAAEDVADLFDVLVEEAERRGIREHQAGGVLVDLAAQILDVDVAARVRLHRRELIARHRHARRVRAVRGVGNHDLPALLVLAAVAEVRVEEHQPGQLALAPGRGLQADRIEAGHLEQDVLQFPFELERALRGVVLDERVQGCEPGQRDEPLVDARVVLHRAAPERVEAGVDPEVAGRELGEVAEHFRLGELRKARRLPPRQLVRHLWHG